MKLEGKRCGDCRLKTRPARGARIEIKSGIPPAKVSLTRPARGARIEILDPLEPDGFIPDAPREGRED